MESKQATPASPAAGEAIFSDSEIEQLCVLRERYERGDFRELSPFHQRLLFTRWLVENGRLSG